jgi:zinc finger protein
MYPFHWVPADGLRHASLDERPCGCRYPTGTEVSTLCRREVVADDGELAWLWETCADCNAEAHRLADRATAP